LTRGKEFCERKSGGAKDEAKTEVGIRDLRKNATKAKRGEVRGGRAKERRIRNVDELVRKSVGSENI